MDIRPQIERAHSGLPRQPQGIVPTPEYIFQNQIKSI
jgi:hypothetical protein